MLLSKSDYMLFLRHPAWLWLKQKGEIQLPPTSDASKAVQLEGKRFEKYAEKLFPEAVSLGFTGVSGPHDYYSLLARTKDAIEQQTKTILQGRLEILGLTCIFDVLERVSNTEFNLMEIKASTHVKPEHLYDLAFQLLVLEKSGYAIRSIFIIHANKDYARHGQIDPIELTIKEDVTAQVRALSHKTAQILESAFTTLNQSTMPDISPRWVNQWGVKDTHWMGEWMAIFKSLSPDLSPYSIYHLCRLNPHQVGELEDQHIALISDIPEVTVHNTHQLAQIITTRRNERVIKPTPIKAFLDSFTFPLYFFDYETFASLIPQFDGCRPYQDYPFQYSLHVLDTPTSPVRHLEYLHEEASNPLPGVLAQLQRDLGESGTVLAWNMSYEQGRNELMADLNPESAVFLHQVNDRMQDLMLPFAQGWYVDQDFFGLASIKKVLPVLVPELDYDTMAIGEGMLARRLWTETILEGKNPAKRDTIMKEMLEYCGLDTFAMVRIYEELQKL